MTISHSGQPMKLVKQDQHSTASASVMQEMLDLLYGMWKTRALGTAIAFKIPDLLEAGPRTIAELALITETHQESLCRLLLALASLGICEELPGEDSSIATKRFGPTERSRCLCSGQQGSLYDMARVMMLNIGWQLWENLAHCVRTGCPVREEGELRKHPEESILIAQAAASLSEWLDPPFVRAYDFSHVDTVMDVGGGMGSLLSTVLQANPHLRGILFDQECVVQAAQTLMVQKHKRERWECIAGDFFEMIPGGADIYIMRNVLIDWPDEKGIQILSNCRKAMRPGGKLLIVEPILVPGQISTTNAFMDLNEMVAGGKMRTETEFHNLLERADLHLLRVISYLFPDSIIESTVF